MNFDSRCVTVCGPNGMGKTNLLESIFLLGATRSNRTRRDVELVRFGEKSYSVSGRFQRSEGGELTVSLSYEEGGRKRGKIDRKEVETLSSMVGAFGVVFVSPEDVEITCGQPERRRQYLDLTLCSIDPVYMRSLQEYNKVHRQRGRVLREFYERPDAKLLDSWDRQLAERAIPVMKIRGEAITGLSGEAEKVYGELGGGEELSIALVSGAGEEETSSIEAFVTRLERNRAWDLKTGRTSTGPHRDDLEILLDGKPIRKFGSRGQHRTAVLALKIAASRFMEKRTGEKPLLLLDDVFTELDASRSLALAERLEGEGQIFATGTGQAGLNRFFPGADGYSIAEEGRLIREG